MSKSLKKEVEWLRSCFKGYEIDEDGLEAIGKVIIKKNKEIEDLKSALRKLK